jgi:hypothetical protein
MIPNLFTEIFESRFPRGYVGKHRAPRQLRHIALPRSLRVPRQHTAAAATATAGTAGTAS